jgi:hypothetical protein
MHDLLHDRSQLSNPAVAVLLVDRVSDPLLPSCPAPADGSKASGDDYLGVVATQSAAASRAPRIRTVAIPEDPGVEPGPRSRSRDAGEVVSVVGDEDDGRGVIRASEALAAAGLGVQHVRGPCSWASPYASRSPITSSRSRPRSRAKWLRVPAGIADVRQTVRRDQLPGSARPADASLLSLLERLALLEFHQLHCLLPCCRRAVFGWGLEESEPT